MSNNKEKKNNLVLLEKSQNNRNDSDFNLIDQIKNGDHSAFSEIIKRYEAKIAATVYGMLGNCQEAEDVGQEVFIRFYKSIEQFKGKSSLGTYLTRIAINLSLNEIKKRKRRTFISWENTNQYDLEMYKSKENNLMFEEKEFIQQAIQKLSSKLQTVLILRLINGHSTEETAKILKLPLGTVLSRLSRGQKKLKKLLTPYMETI